MTVETITHRRLRAWLTDDEMEEWGLTHAKPSMGRVRRLVRQITAAAGWSERRVTAELISVEGGGLLLVSSEEPTPSPWPLVYRLRDGDALLDLMRQWRYIAQPSPLCVVYGCGTEYAVAVYPDAPLSPRWQSVLEEYGIPAGSGEGAAARWGEYGTIIGTFTGRVPPLPERGDPLH